MILAIQALLIIALLYLLWFKILPVAFSFRDNSPPFIPTRGAVVGEIIPLLKLTPNSVLYDLGCGDGRILLEARRSVPSIKAVGIDYSWIPVLTARFRTRKTGIKIIRADIFKTPLHEATHIYCYLFPKFLAELEPKILAECRPGTRIVSCDFEFPNLVPVETVTLTSRKYNLSKTARVYVVPDKQ